MTTANVYTGNSFREGGREYAPGFANSALPKYAFNAKELDEETGMYYYEARYMAPPTFTSRDPHFERYFWTTPYGYCNNNPLKYVDPTGMETQVFPFPRPSTGIGISIKMAEVLLYHYNASRYTMTISNTSQAVKHYYLGGGNKVNIDSKFAASLMKTQAFNEMHQKIITGKNIDKNGKAIVSGSFPVDMTKEDEAFFIGRTGVNYEVSTSEDKKTCIVTYTFFTKGNEADDFSDPNFLLEQKTSDKKSRFRNSGDGMGPKLELGGVPYKFK